MNDLKITNTGTFTSGQTIKLGYKPMVLITVGRFSSDNTIRFCYYDESLSDSTFAYMVHTTTHANYSFNADGNALKTINADGFTYGAGNNGTVSGAYIAYK